MQAQAVEQYLSSLNGGWVDYANSVDRWKAGDPHIEIQGIAVAWMSWIWALEKAKELGCNVFITHEPTFYHHYDNDPAILKWPEVQAKQEKIKELGLSIYRCHDLWDQMPDIGIPDSWGKKLGLGPPVAGQGYFRVYEGHGRTAYAIAKDMAARVKDLGQAAVQLIGPSDRKIYRIVVGTGAITPYRQMLLDYQADLVICSDDGFSYWRDGAHAIDTGQTVLVFHHQVAEDYGMELLANHLAEKFAPLPVHFIQQQCMYQLLSAD